MQPDTKTITSGAIAGISLILFLRFLRYFHRTRIPVKPSEHARIMCQALQANRFHNFSAQQLAAMIKSGEASSQEIIQAHIDHIKMVNPMLNAVVKNRFEEAMEEARGVDEMLERYREEEKSLDDLPVLLGVPCTIKECFALTGMPNASGLVSRAHVICDVDATVVARIRGTFGYFGIK